MSREAIRAAIEQAPVRAYLYEVAADDYVLVAVNAVVRTQRPEIVALYGRPQASLYADQPTALLDAKRAVEGRGVVVREMPFRRFDQLETTQTLRLTYAFVPDKYLLIYSEDVSPPSGAEAALRESEERYRGLVASSPDGIVLRGREGTVLACNQAAARLFCRSSVGELIGKRRLLPEGHHAEDEAGHPLEPYELPGSVVASTGEAILGRVHALVDPGGSRRWVRVSAQPFRDAQGALTGSVTTFTDETERVNVQRALQESATRLELALDAAQMGTWEWDPTCGEGSWSENLYRIFRIPKTLHGVEAFHGAVHPGDRARVAELTRQLADASDGVTFEEEWRLTGEDGQTRWARFGGRVLRHGDHTRIVGTAMDRTDRRRLEEELLSARRLESLGRLAGGIAHDFNNLLGAILGSLELIADTVPPETSEDLRIARYATERAGDLTRQLLAFARRQVIKPAVVDLSRLLANVEEMLQRLVGRQVKLQVEPDEAVYARVDAPQIEQVLINLVVNARDATPPGGRIGVRLTAVELGVGAEVPPGSYAELSVWDTGAGMDPETLSHAFDPFFTTKDTGTGLGLASCYGVVQQHGGHITVESAAGHGTRFRILLPRAEAPPDAAGASSPPLRTGGGGSGRVLLVDDDPLIRSATKRTLEILGYNVLVAESGNEATEVLAREGRVDVVVCDVVMPDETGPEVARKLVRAQPDLKVVFVSGFPAEAFRDEHVGATFLQKPFSRAELARKVAEAIGGGAAGEGTGGGLEGP